MAVSVIRRHRRQAHLTNDPLHPADGVYRTLCGRSVEAVSFMGFFGGAGSVAVACTPEWASQSCTKCVRIHLDKHPPPPVEVTNDPFRLQREVKAAYVQYQQRSLTDSQFISAVCESVRNTTNLVPSQFA